VVGDEPRAAAPARWPSAVRLQAAGATSRYDAQLKKHLKQAAAGASLKQPTNEAAD
jgi:hypothetical protein